MSCQDIAQCFNTETKKMVDYAWRPVTDGKLLGFLGSIACKKRGWFPYENGHALVSHRAISSPWSGSYLQGEGLSLPCLDDPPQRHLVDC